METLVPSTGCFHAATFILSFACCSYSHFLYYFYKMMIHFHLSCACCEQNNNLSNEHTSATNDTRWMNSIPSSRFKDKKNNNNVQEVWKKLLALFLCLLLIFLCCIQHHRPLSSLFCLIYAATKTWWIQLGRQGMVVVQKREKVYVWFQKYARNFIKKSTWISVKVLYMQG